MKAVSAMKNVPLVSLVIQGGVGTLGSIISDGMNATPVIILADSGGAATAIYRTASLVAWTQWRTRLSVCRRGCFGRYAIQHEKALQR